MTEKPKDTRPGPKTPGAVFVALGVVFLAVGSSGQRGAFLAIGAVFIVLGFALLARQRRGTQ
jgi:hypothetical protein